MSSLAERKKKSLIARSNSSNRLSGIFKSILGKKAKKPIVVLVDDDERNIKEITTMIESLKHDVEVLSAKDGIDGLVLLKTHGVDVRLCLADMVMPGCSGIELLNRARADPALLHVTFALMTESSSGKDGKKSLSHFQVSDDRGEPVSVLIKPLHSALVDDMLQRLNQTPEETAVQRKHSNASLLNAGLEADPDWSRTRSRSDWGKRSDMPKSSPSGSESSSPRSGLSPGRESPSAQAGLTLSAPSPGTGSGSNSANSSPHNSGLRPTGVPSALDSPATRRASGSSPRRGSGTFSGATGRSLLANANASNSSGSSGDIPKLQRQKSNTVSFDSREEAMEALSSSPTDTSPVGNGDMPRSVSSFHISDKAPNSPEIPRSTSLYAIDQAAAMSPRVRRLRRNNNGTSGSPLSSPRSPRRGSRLVPQNEVEDGEAKRSPRRGSRLVPNDGGDREDGEVKRSPRRGSRLVPGHGAPEEGEESKVDAGSKRWSKRHNQDGIVDESQGVNDIMFDSISSLDRTQVPRSVSMDALNWDEVV